MNEIFAVVINKTIHHEGDERSRTHPGHGYPAYSETFKEFKEFKSDEDFIRWIETNPKTTYTAYKCSPLTVAKEVKYTIK